MDAAPSGHLIRLLDLPHLIAEWLKLFFSLLLKYRKVIRLPRLSDRLVRLSRELKALRGLLVDPKMTALWAITIPTRLALDKTREMVDNLNRIGLNPSNIFINQITPKRECDLCEAINKRQVTQIARARKLFPSKNMTLIYLQSDPGGLTGLDQLGKLLYYEASAEAVQ